MGGGYGDRGDGGGLGAEDSRPEGHGSPCVLSEEGHLFGGPTAFGPDGYGVGDSDWERVHVPPISRIRVFQCGGESGGLFGFAEEDSRGRPFLLEGLLEGARVGDLGDVSAAGLLGGFESDATPAFGTLESSLGEMLFSATGEDRSDAGDAEFSGLFDGPLHVIELEDGEEEMEGKGGVGG